MSFFEMIFGKKKKNEPVSVSFDEPGVGTFTKQNGNIFHCISDLSGDEVYVDLECDEGFEDKCYNSLARLRELLTNYDALRLSVINAVVDEHTDDDGFVYPWSIDGNFVEDDTESRMTPDEFRTHLSISVIEVCNNRTVDFWVELDGLYTDHCESVSMDDCGNITGCMLLG